MRHERKLRGRAATLVEEMIGALRQLGLEPALRIARPVVGNRDPALAELSAELARLATLLQASLNHPPERATAPAAVAPVSPTSDDRALHRAYADLANGWFRIWIKTLQPGTDRPTEPMRRIFPFLESMRDTLEQLGLEIIDHTGKEIPEGLELEVLGYQVRAGLKRDRVIETVRPTVYFRDQMIQMGRVYAETAPAEERSPEERK